MTGDYVPPDRKLYLTPDAPVTGRFCRSLSIPDDPAWVGAVDGALSQLAEAESWREFGDLTPEETAQEFLGILDEAWNNPSCGSGEIPTPYWDGATDVDDELPTDTQPWYGYVTDPEAPADELTFVENAAIWTFTGFLAVSGTPAAAILFNTIAPSFVLAMRGNDFGEVIRILVDGADAATVDTTGHAGEVIQVPIAADPALSTHDVMLIKVS